MKMALSKLPQKRSDGIEYIDSRAGLYYGKYKYRARIYISGITAAWWASTETELDVLIKRSYRWKNLNKSLLLSYFMWINSLPPKTSKTYSIRLEGNTAAVFSNDLNLLKTAESIGAVLDYTEVDQSVPQGTKYFVREPAHKFRFYLKSKRVSDSFPADLQNFIDRYSKTDTVIIPSPALSKWLNRGGVAKYIWMRNYCSSSYFIDYDDESTLTLFTLLFDGMISRRFKLEKRPE